MNKVLVDTNLLIYTVDEDSRYFSQAHRIISDPGVELATTSKNLSEFLAVVTRIPRNAMPINDALAVLADFMSVFKILYPSERSSKILINLIKKYQPVGLEIHDFEIASIGLASGITQIATLNKKDFNRIKEISLYPV